jgi:hypothetical protein
MDQSINIGYYNDTIIISDDYQITEKSLDPIYRLKLSKVEEQLIKLFPSSEIVTVACNSFINFHGYSLIHSGDKMRIKTISSEEPRKEYGPRMPEEEAIYSNSFEKDGANFWKDKEGLDEIFTEDQYMEDFTFGIAKRLLDVELNYGDGTELMEKIVFKKYLNSIKVSSAQKEENKKKRPILTYAIIVSVVLLWQIVKRFVLK